MWERMVLSLGIERMIMLFIEVGNVGEGRFWGRDEDLSLD